MPEWEGRDDFGLNFQIGKDDGPEIQTDLDIVTFVELAANRLSPGNLAIHYDAKLPRDSCLELRSCPCELGLRHNPVVIFIKFRNLRRVLDRERQCCLQAVRWLSYR